MPAYVVGDIHGYLGILLDLLKNDVGLVDKNHQWIGGKTVLCFVGDYFDRGPQGTDTIKYVMQLQRQAAAVGGRVYALLGNHDIMFLAAHRFGQQAIGNSSWSYRLMWEQIGGVPHDMQIITPAEIAWLQQRPAMLKLGDYLVMHCDSDFYLKFGDTIEQINRYVIRSLQEGDMEDYGELWDNFIDRFLFADHDRYGHLQLDNMLRVHNMLDLFGAKYIVHGHTPVARMANIPAHLVNGPFIYAEGTCINIDHGLHQGGTGFIYMLPYYSSSSKR